MADLLKRAISIRQPYVEQILKGIKVREYRTVPTNIRERVYLYASERPGDWYDFELLGYDKETLPRGVLVGSVEIVGCERHAKTDGYAYLLAEPRRLKKTLKPTRHPQPIWFNPF